MVRSWPKVRGVAWSSAPRDVPAALEMLRFSGHHQDLEFVDAFASVLWDQFVHQGSINPDTALAVPFVFDILEASPALARNSAPDDPQEQKAWSPDSPATRANFRSAVARWFAHAACAARRHSENGDRGGYGRAVLDRIADSEHRLARWQDRGLADEELLLRLATPAFVDAALETPLTPNRLAVVVRDADVVCPRVIPRAQEALVALGDAIFAHAAELLPKRVRNELNEAEMKFLGDAARALAPRSFRHARRD